MLLELCDESFYTSTHMWGVIGVKGKLTNEKCDNYATLLDVWETDNSKIVTWINFFCSVNWHPDWQSMLRKKKFWITWKGYTLSRALQNNINWRMIFEPSNKALWMLRISMLLCMICRISWLSHNLLDWKNLDIAFLEWKNNIWCSFVLWHYDMNLKDYME